MFCILLLCQPSQLPKTSQPKFSRRHGLVDLRKCHIILGPWFMLRFRADRMSLWYEFVLFGFGSDGSKLRKLKKRRATTNATRTVTMLACVWYTRGNCYRSCMVDSLSNLSIARDDDDDDDGELTTWTVTESRSLNGQSGAVSPRCWPACR